MSIKYIPYRVELYHRWPDGTVIHADEYSEHEYGFKGDDFETLRLDQLTTEQQLEMMGT